MKTAMTKAEAFEVLGLRGDATEEEVKTAYRSLSKRVHPDAGGSDELFRRVHAAYERLTMGPDRDDEPACRAEPSRESDWAPRNEPPDHTRRGLRWWQWPFLVGLGPTTARGCVAQDCPNFSGSCSSHSPCSWPWGASLRCRCGCGGGAERFDGRVRTRAEPL